MKKTHGRESVKRDAAQKVVNVLASMEGLAVDDGVEVLSACINLIKEQMHVVLAEEGKKPLAGALGHLNRSDIKIVR